MNPSNAFQKWLPQVHNTHKKHTCPPPIFDSGAVGLASFCGVAFFVLEIAPGAFWADFQPMFHLIISKLRKTWEGLLKKTHGRVLKIKF